mgnify:CR=1 FL=1
MPEWFRTTLPVGEAQIQFNETKSRVKENNLHTVCEEARCPNVHDCWGRGTATFMIAGQECTRSCRFCAVGTIKTPPALDENEPRDLAQAVSNMGISHVVITVVNRDDLDDGGASHYKECIKAVNEGEPKVTIEFLCSDLDGNMSALAYLLDESPLSVFAHNVECVPRLDQNVRDSRASFSQSLAILKEAKKLRPDILTKTSLMVGVGETDDEIEEALVMLREAGVDIITLLAHHGNIWRLTVSQLLSNLQHGMNRPVKSVSKQSQAGHLYGHHIEQVCYSRKQMGGSQLQLLQPRERLYPIYLPAHLKMGNHENHHSRSSVR